MKVRELYQAHDSDLKLNLLSGKKGLEKEINNFNLQTLGLSLVGECNHLKPFSLQIIGESEYHYLKKKSFLEVNNCLKKIFKKNISTFIISDNHSDLEHLKKICQENEVCLFTSPLTTNSLLNTLESFFIRKNADSISIHGVFLNIFGTGTLLKGKSGIGKSETALELIFKGHSLIADDIIQVTKHPSGKLVGRSHQLNQNYMEIRGLGLINIQDLFGVGATYPEKIIEIVIELIEWNPKQEYDRLGLSEEKYEILNYPLPYLKIPVHPGRNITSIIEVAAKNHRLKKQGNFSAQNFENKLNQKLKENK
ncbi:MAG: HPr(Ser) kinase/phosphatase [Deltaproteobacteria bacterium]|nr:HPr(Ser) kinase/phosphatase [Deltaproteobacteria bacterium]